MDTLESSNKNRLIGSFEKHSTGKSKTDIVKELIQLINPKIKVQSVQDSINSQSAIHVVTKSDFVFACFDNDGPRAFTNELVQVNKIPCLDLATGIHVDSMDYGGRIIFIDDSGCLMCLDELDQDEIRAYNESSMHRVDNEAIYGVDKSNLKDSGPSVVSIICSKYKWSYCIPCSN